MSRITEHYIRQSEAPGEIASSSHRLLENIAPGYLTSFPLNHPATFWKSLLLEPCLNSRGFSDAILENNWDLPPQRCEEHRRLLSSDQSSKT